MSYLFRKTVFDCRQATFLSIKKEDGKITLMERIKLGYHLLYCDPCRRFVSQWKTLRKLVRARTAHSRFTLSDDARERISREIQKLDS